MLKRIFFLCLLVGMAAAKPVTTRLFEVNAPDAWEERQTPSALYFLYPGKDTDEPEDANVSINANNISGTMSMDSLTYMGKFQIEQAMPNMKLVSSNPMKVGKLDGHRFEWKGTNKGKKSVLIQVFAMNGRQSYEIKFIGSETDYNSQRSSFESLLRSFRPL
ncbi:hypothetical protein JST97_01405 [bacterium]|nr:hypothetical protein [bacterium]